MHPTLRFGIVRSVADEMTIGRLAKVTGVAQTTIRFYEREGLIRAAGRSSRNCRLYRRAAAERLTFIGAAQAAGFTLPEVKAILALESGRVSCGTASQIVKSRLVGLRERMLKLRQLERVLQKVERASSSGGTDAPCIVPDAFVLRRWLRR